MKAPALLLFACVRAEPPPDWQPIDYKLCTMDLSWAMNALKIMRGVVTSLNDNADDCSKRSSCSKIEYMNVTDVEKDYLRAMDYNNTVIRDANYSYHNALWADKGPEACSEVSQSAAASRQACLAIFTMDDFFPETWEDTISDDFYLQMTSHYEKALNESGCAFSSL